MRLGLLFGLVVIMGMLAGTVFAGAFTFDPPVGTSVVTPSPPVWGAAGDFDEDGILDVAVTSGPPTLHIMFGNRDGQGNGDGTFTHVGIGYAGENPGMMKVGDVDKDGNLDIVWADNANGALTVVLGDGNGGFGLANRIPVVPGMRSVALGDLNGDTYLDLIGGSCCTSASYLLNNGVSAPGTFGQVNFFSDAPLPGNPARAFIEVVDLNGDSEPDVVIGNQSSDISVLLAKSIPATLIPPNPLGFSRSQLVDNGTSSANGLAVGDFNGDSIPDLAANHLVFGVTVFLGIDNGAGIGTGTFGPAATYQTGSCLPFPFTLQVAAADFDGDGNLDLAATNQFCDNISVLMGDGAGSFSPPANFPDPIDRSVIYRPSTLLTDDFNGDGKIDLLTGAIFSRTVAVMFNTTIVQSDSLGTIIDDLQAIVDANPGPVADKVQDALDKARTALAETEKDPPDNQAAMGNIEGAVGDLEAAVKDGLLGAEGTDLMDRLAAIAAQIAQDAIDEAIARGGDPATIADAQAALDDGDALRASGAFKDAVGKYKDALAKAEGASPFRTKTCKGKK